MFASGPLNVKKVRRVYVKRPDIWLPVLLTLFLLAFTCRTFLEIILRYGRVMLTDSTRKYLCRIVGLYDKKNNNALCYHSVADS